MRIRPLLCLWLCLALAVSARGEPEDHGPGAVQIEVYCADLRPGDDSTRQAFDLWLDLLRHGKAAPFEPARLVCRKQYAVQDAHEFDARERFEPAFEAVLAGHILRDPQTHALHVFFTKAGIVYFPRLQTEPNLRMIDFIHPVIQVAGGEVWVGPTRGFDLTTRIRLTVIVVRGVSAPTGWKETASGAASTSRGHLLTHSAFALGHPSRKAPAVVQVDPAVVKALGEGKQPWAKR